jgi:methionyl-tRNA formyltransferase
VKTVFLGSGAFGIPTLEMLSARHELLAIVTQPDRPAGRKRRLTPTPVGQWAQANRAEIPLMKPENINEASALQEVRAFDVGSEGERAGAWVVIAFGQKLSQGLLDDRFAINLHASLLPRWRGAAPINHAILAGDHETGNSVITLADRMDAGLVLGQSRRAIEPGHTAGELHDLLASDGPDLIAGVLDRYASDTLDPVTQDESLVTIASKLRKEHGLLDPALPAAKWRAHIHGLNPWPGVTMSLRGEPLKLLRAQDAEPPAQSAGMEPGQVINPEAGLIACGEASAITLLEVQPPGKRPMPWGDFARGARVEAGERLARLEGTP